LRIDTISLPLADVEHAWALETPTGIRVVLTPTALQAISDR
jgi:hypothetical protein